MFAVRRAAAALALTALFAATPVLSADAPPNPRSVELARKLFDNMHMDQLMSGMMRQMAPAMTAQMRKSNPNLTDADAQAISECGVRVHEHGDEEGRGPDDPDLCKHLHRKELQDVVTSTAVPAARPCWPRCRPDGQDGADDGRADAGDERRRSASDLREDRLHEAQRAARPEELSARPNRLFLERLYGGQRLVDVVGGSSDE